MELGPFLVVGLIGLGSYMIIYRDRIAHRLAVKNPRSRYVDQPRVWLVLGIVNVMMGLLRAAG